MTKIQEQEILETQELPEADESPSEVLIFSIPKKTFQELTQRNQDFMISLNGMISEEALVAETRLEVFNEIAETLLAGQDSGQTARQLYGTPSETAELVLKRYTEEQEATVEAPENIRGIDGGLLLGSFYVILNGFTVMKTPEASAQGQVMGMLSILVNYVLAVISMKFITRSMPDFDASKGERGYIKYIAVSMLAMIIWVIGINGSMYLLPPSINPPLPYMGYFIIGALGFLVRWYIRRQYNIKGRIF